MSLKEPIVEGECPFCGSSDCLRFMCNGAATLWYVNCWKCGATGPVRCADISVPDRTAAAKELAAESWKTRAGYRVPTDPAEVVAELRAMQERATERSKINVAIALKANALAEAADLVAERFGVDERSTLCWCRPFGRDRCPRHSEKLGVKS